MDDIPGNFGSGVRALNEMEATVLGAEGLEGVVLRYGFFYGPGTYYGEDGTTTADVRRRRMPIVGKGTGLFSFVHVDDAADATVAAVERGAPGIYNVTDDEPAPMREWLPGVRRGGRARSRRAACRSGSRGSSAAARCRRSRLELRGASNEKAKRELGWEPAHPTWRTGFREARIASRSGRSPARTRRSPPSPPARRSRSARACASGGRAGRCAKPTPISTNVVGRGASRGRPGPGLPGRAGRGSSRRGASEHGGESILRGG